jgi:TnpA family transposase
MRSRLAGLRRTRNSELNLVVDAIVLWNTVYLERAIGGLRQQGQTVDDRLLASPLAWDTSI